MSSCALYSDECDPTSDVRNLIVIVLKTVVSPCPLQLTLWRVRYLNPDLRGRAELERPGLLRGGGGGGVIDGVWERDWGGSDGVRGGGEVAGGEGGGRKKCRVQVRLWKGGNYHMYPQLIFE